VYFVFCILYFVFYLQGKGQAQVFCTSAEDAKKLSAAFNKKVIPQLSDKALQVVPHRFQKTSVFVNGIKSTVVDKDLKTVNITLFA
jgi:hypothetical protein